MNRTHYPEFDVLKGQDTWDPHTRDIVTARMQPKEKGTFLTTEELATLMVVITHILYENRPELVAFVCRHIDAQLQNRLGESERKVGIPPEAELVTLGIQALDAAAQEAQCPQFTTCSTEQQYSILSRLQKGQLNIVTFAAEQQKAFFQKLLSRATEAYASHPQVWSEMGYPGPAYPRGYYRIELGLHDPWEPVREEQQ